MQIPISICCMAFPNCHSRFHNPTMENPKQFMALVNGAFMRTFQRDESITPELLKEQVFPGEDTTVEGSLVAQFRI